MKVSCGEFENNIVLVNLDSALRKKLTDAGLYPFKIKAVREVGFGEEISLGEYEAYFKDVKGNYIGTTKKP